MITHVALFSWKPATTGDDVAAAQAALLALPGEIPELRTYRAGPDVGVATGNADFGVVATFDDIDGWRAYVEHPAHQAVLAQYLRPHIATRAAVQIES